MTDKLPALRISSRPTHRVSGAGIMPCWTWMEDVNKREQAIADKLEKIETLLSRSDDPDGYKMLDEIIKELRGAK